MVGGTVQPTLSVILVVRDAEDRLQDDVCELLEMLPELTPHFQVAVIDDGSIDETITLARELARRFPQVSAWRQSLPYGPQAALELGLRQTSGEFILVKESSGPLSAVELLAIWQLRDDPQLVMVQWPRHASADSLAGVRSGSLRMLRRTAICRLADCRHPERHLQVEPYWREDSRATSPSDRRAPYLIRVTHGFVASPAGSRQPNA